MPRRIDIELTSHAPDGSWTWRAAGAKQPRGSVDGALVPDGATTGAVYRAEVESGIEGIEVISLATAKAPTSEQRADNRIEVVGTQRRGPDVSVMLAGGGRRGRGREDRERPPRRERPGREDRARRPGGPARAVGVSEGLEELESRQREEGGAEGRPAGPRRAGAGRGREERGERGERGERRRPEGPRRPTLSTTHRNAALATLRPEQLPVAEQLLRGGIPAVRQAIAEQNTAARSTGGQPAPAEAILAMAEELLPAMKLAEWKDRASTAIASGRELRLRELRAVVTASRTVTLDDEARTMAKSLSDSLDSRVTALRDEWQRRISNALSEGRVLDALRASARPPEPGTRCPAELAVRLAEGAGTAMTADLDPGEWQALLEAVMESPVRRTVKPAGIPADEKVHAAALHAAGAVPELAKLLGLRIPPPPPRGLRPSVGGASRAVGP